jgi:uncharacterized 2Fe-2S/4Fe-4S cluster protein (DUF4445 family)
MSQQVKVTFQPQGRSVSVLRGSSLVEAASQAGMTIATPCGGAGACGKCRVLVTAGAPSPTGGDASHFSPQELAAGWRLGCQIHLSADVVVHVPEASLFGSDHQILVERQSGAAGEVLPGIRKVHVALPPPTMADCAADLLRLERAIGPVKADLATLRELPSLMRACGFDGTAVLTDHRLIDLEPGDTTAHCCGAAFDIGTTTLVGSLLDLRTGEELAVASAINPQVKFGDDVVSRIRHAATPEGLAQLRSAVLEAVENMLQQLCDQSGVARERIYEVAFAGNTTMQHLLCGIDPSPLGVSPFVPAHGHGLLLPAAELGVRIHPRGMACVFAVIGGFVGGDTVAGVLATDLANLPGPVLMVDIGTNGEIVLAHNGALAAASTAAGPAFEGARISCGMRATRGAIEKVVFDDDIRIGVIGDAPARGLCGSGLIDVAAELLRCGIVTPEGRLLPPEELPPLPPAIAARVGVDPAGQTVVALSDAPGGGRVLITQRDIRELQLAAGAIRAGISILLRQSGLATADLKRVLIAGGFGSFIRRRNAQRIGLLPADIPHEHIVYVGNASLNGAKAALLSVNARKQAEHLASLARHVELSLDAQFQMEFAECMIFPRQLDQG